MPETLNAFSLKWGGKDRNLRRATALVCRAYIKEDGHFPDTVLSQKNNKQDRYDHLAKKVQRAIKEVPRLASGEEETGKRIFVHTVKNWATDDAELGYRVPIYNEMVPLKILYYFKYYYTNPQGQPDEKYFLLFQDTHFEAPGDVAKRRTERIAEEKPKKAEGKEYLKANSNDKFLQPIGVLTESIDEQLYVSYPKPEVDRYFRELSEVVVEEIFEDRIDWTKGDPADDPEGIVRSWLNDGRYGLRWSEDFRQSVQNRIQTLQAPSQFIELGVGYRGAGQNDLFSQPFLTPEILGENLSKLPEPDKKIWNLAIDCVGNTERIPSLYEASIDELKYGIARCLTFHEQGTNLKLSAYFFDLLSQVDNFSDFTRFAASYLRAVFETLRGNIQGIYNACDRAEFFLRRHSGGNLSHINSSLFAKIHARRSSNTFTALSIPQLNEIAVSKIENELAISLEFSGLHDGHFENPDHISAMIARRPDRANSIYLISEVYYSTQILRCIVDNDDASELFRRHLIINQAMAEIESHTACVVLTPMMALAEIANLPNIALKIYGWRHGLHPVPEVNQIRKIIDSKSNFGIEAAIELLSTYSFMRNRARNGDHRSEQICENLKNELLGVKDKMQSISMSTVHRYYARFEAEALGSKLAYIKSESDDAYSHNLYFGRWTDQFSMT